MLLKRASAISRTAGRPLRRMSLQALENRSTTTRMVVKPLEEGKSVAKSTPRWDQGRRRIPAGVAPVCPQADDEVLRSWHRLSIPSQTGWHPGPCWATNTFPRGVRGFAACLGDRIPETHVQSPEGKFVRMWVRMFYLLDRPAELVPLQWRHECCRRETRWWDIQIHTNRFGGSKGSISSGRGSGEWIRDKASALVFLCPG